MRRRRAAAAPKRRTASRPPPASPVSRARHSRASGTHNTALISDAMARPTSGLAALRNVASHHPVTVLQNVVHCCYG
jgi:hypothetical protein